MRGIVWLRHLAKPSALVDLGAADGLSGWPNNRHDRFRVCPQSLVKLNRLDPAAIELRLVITRVCDLQHAPVEALTVQLLGFNEDPLPVFRVQLNDAAHVREPRRVVRPAIQVVDRASPLRADASRELSHQSLHAVSLLMKNGVQPNIRTCDS